MDTPDVKIIAYKSAGTVEETRLEKIHNVIFENSKIASKTVAHEIAAIIREKAVREETCVLGLATGSSPILVYEELIRLHKEEGLSFSNVISFNLDEYYGLSKDNQESYYYFMHQHLFDHVDILPENVHVPDGTISPENILNYCQNYEEKILLSGGLDFQLLGIGRTGHIGFNEPGSHINSMTRLLTLDHITRVDAASSFLGIQNVPRKAITMGIATVLSARRIVLLGWGSHKASVLNETIEGWVSSEVPATYLQEHRNTTIVLDIEAASELTRVKTPWLVGNCKWTELLKRRAVIWLSQKLEISILKLTDKDYNAHDMSDLLQIEGTAYDLNIKVFNFLQRSITGWPGGKFNAEDTYRPERATPQFKRVLILSPHPDDDVISMGGTLDRLVEQGHEVHVVYQTSGNFAVSDDEALKYARVAQTISTDKFELKKMIDYIGRGTDDPDNALLMRKIKGAIRKQESQLATSFLGVPADQVHFLNMPFYETGQKKKDKLGSEDLRLMTEIIKKIAPHQIYAAGDLADPHGTHKVCLEALFQALEILKGKEFLKDCWVWLYRGAWHEWEMHEIDMAVPLSPDQVIKKRLAIFYHQSQKDGVMFQGDDPREFWVRAEDRNRKTAKAYNDLGLSDYAAMETFKRYHFHSQQTISQLGPSVT